ncbi:Solute carrier family 25 member 44-like protein [Drosera capensis]
MDSAAASRAQFGGPMEINWDKLDKTKFYVVGAGLFTGVTVALYPLSVVKTRIQVASKDVAEKNALSVFRGILRNDGVLGLYRGFGTVIIGAIPTRIIFLTALETTKVAAYKMVQPFGLSEATQAALANGIAGMIGSISAQAVFVPIDVVSQKLMVQGYSGHASYNGGLDVARKIVKSDGIRGLYRGFGLSIMTYSPSSAVWWASYGSSQQLFWTLLNRGSENETVAPSQLEIASVQAAGGVVAGATASFITTPLDTIKTRLQSLTTVLAFLVFWLLGALYGDKGPKNSFRGSSGQGTGEERWLARFLSRPWSEIYQHVGMGNLNDTGL